MANIIDKVKKIREAIYGKDVRENIASGIEAINEEVKSTTGKQDLLETEFDQLIINAGNSNAEIVQARVDLTGNSYPNLKERMDKSDAQLADIEQQVTDIITLKPSGADDTTLIQNAINNLTNGGTINLKRGSNFLISSSINIVSDIILDGNGSKIILTSNSDYAIKITGSKNFIKGLIIEKDKSLVSSGIFVRGIENYFENITSRDCKWTTFVHGQGLKESHFSKIRVDGDVATKTGIIFNFDYCVNNTITQSMIGYADTGVYCSTIVDPMNGNKSEGLIIDDCIIVHCDKGTIGDSVTQLTVSNSILDFCGSKGISVTNGQSLTVTNNWIAVNTDNNGIAIATSQNFYYCFISGNRIVGDTSFASYALSIACSKAIVVNNQITDLSGGNITTIDSICKDNIVTNGSDIICYKKTYTTYIDNSGGASIFNHSDSLISLFAVEMYTSNYLYAVGFKGAQGVDTHKLTVVGSSGLTLGSTNNLGTQVIVGATNSANVRMMATSILQ